MIRRFSPSRRAVVAWMTGLAVTASAGWMPRSGLEAASVEAVLGGWFPHRDSARAVGRAYLALAPGEASVGYLRALLAPVSDAATFAARVRSDFTNADVVTVDGWTLSATEVRACALLALTDA